jgi:hypothetical protein
MDKFLASHGLVNLYFTIYTRGKLCFGLAENDEDDSMWFIYDKPESALVQFDLCAFNDLSEFVDYIEEKYG